MLYDKVYLANIWCSSLFRLLRFCVSLRRGYLSFFLLYLFLSLLKEYFALKKVINEHSNANAHLKRETKRNAGMIDI